MTSGSQILLGDGRAVEGTFSIWTGAEKGIDVRIALDMVKLAHQNEYDIGIIFSQDQDLAEAVQEVWDIVKRQARSIELYFAFPVSSSTRNTAPIRGTKAIEILAELYFNSKDPSRSSHVEG